MPPKRKAASVSSSSSAKRRRASSTLSPPELEPETQPEPVPRVAGFDDYRINLTKGDVLYIPNFVSESESQGWYEALAALPTWHHPTLRWQYTQLVLETCHIPARTFPPTPHSHPPWTGFAS
ncbi:hypothetical protein CcaverHIS641_0210070 [Cutaneotrichosporon cavernicola]|nr:hypothetical protein CcaverHIS641_0210070 [Cutaneotrichosporon cavernicola]